jgi:putative DNA-invertase from lambdoid prophage Rac
VSARSATGEKLRAAFYLRVSTIHQRTENQRPAIEQIVRTRGFGVVAEYEEHESAVKRRPRFETMMDDARRGRFDVLVIWALDRLGRSMVGSLLAVIELDRLGVRIVSVQEAWLDTSGPLRDLLIPIFLWIAEQERASLIARTKAGIETARRHGKQIGRRRRYVDRDRARELVAGGASLRTVAKTLGIGLGTLHRALSEKPAAALVQSGQRAGVALTCACGGLDGQHDAKWHRAQSPREKTARSRTP